MNDKPEVKPCQGGFGITVNGKWFRCYYENERDAKDVLDTMISGSGIGQVLRNCEWESPFIEGSEPPAPKSARHRGSFGFGIVNARKRA